MKNCTKCQEAKPATTEFFSVSKTNKNGLSSWCKICINNKSKDIRKSSKGKEYNSNYFINGNGKLKLQEFTKNNPNTQRNSALKNKYNEIIKHETQFEMINMENAEYVIVAYGTTARICRSAIEALKEKKINVGMIRPITLWPFPRKAFDLIPRTTKGILVCEMSMGQMIDDVFISNKGRLPVGFYGRAGGMVPEPEEIVEAILHFDEKVVEV
jgi:pyruvate/2-oxoacid:ferredoxin oxidoreductase alpha subunit